MGAKNTKFAAPVTTATSVTTTTAAAQPNNKSSNLHIEYWAVYLTELYYLVRRNIIYKSAFNSCTDFDPSKLELLSDDIICIKLLMRQDLSLYEGRCADWRFNRLALMTFIDNNDVSDMLTDNVYRTVKKSLLRKCIKYTYKRIMKAERQRTEQQDDVMCQHQRESTAYFLDEYNVFLFPKNRKLCLPRELRQHILRYVPPCANEYYWKFSKW